MRPSKFDTRGQRMVVVQGVKLADYEIENMIWSENSCYWFVISHGQLLNMLGVLENILWNLYLDYIKQNG